MFEHINVVGARRGQFGHVFDLRLRGSEFPDFGRDFHRESPPRTAAGHAPDFIRPIVGENVNFLEPAQREVREPLFQEGFTE